MSKSMTDKFFVCQTELGWIAVLLSPHGLKASTLPRSSAVNALRELPLGPEAVPADQSAVADLVRRLQLYASGHRVVFNDRLDLAGATPLQQAVWQATQKIPYGETRSYRWVAELAGRPQAVRAVGHALGQNPLPLIIPCHRVLRSDGSLGGYTGGLDIKDMLLLLEGTRLSALPRTQATSLKT